MATTDAIELLREAADTLEELLSTEPDMPTYDSTYEHADEILERVRSALEAIDAAKEE